MCSALPALKLLLLLLLPFSLFAQRTRISEMSAPLSTTEKIPGEEDANPLAGRENWTEIPSERTLHSSTYRTPDGRVIIHYSREPLNYYASPGELQPVDPALSPEPGGQSWTAANQPYPTYLFPDGKMAVTLDNGQALTFGAHCRVNGSWEFPENELPSAIREDRVLMQNVAPGVDKELYYRVNAIKYNYIIRQPLQLPTGYFTASEELSFPQGYSLERNTAEGREIDGNWCGDYFLRSASGEIVAQIKAPVCFDANQAWTVAGYRLETVNGVTRLTIVLPASWLNDPQRAYPVTVDPLVTGPVALWTGGSMPSCIAPAANVDSILVTIPAQITITSLMVTSSFYADPFTTAVMADGAMWFSTTCNTSQQFTVQPPTGNTPGTAYLDTFNLRVPLLCCFPQSCNQRTFYLRMHLSRTQPGSGCNTTYIRYDPTTTLWPFSAYVVGRTAESFGNGFAVQNTPVCSNQCTFNGTMYLRYGVPPYTISHPWLANSITVGNAVGCSFGTTTQPLTFHIPNCPVYCDTSTSLPVPPPTVTDACGNTVSGLPTRTLTIKPTPQVSASPDPDSLCSGEPVSVTLTPCLGGSNVTWSGNNTSGSGNISDAAVNNTTSAATVYYLASASLNGCQSDTIVVPVVIDPPPQAAFISQDPAIAGVPVAFTDQTIFYAGNGSSWLWNFGDSTTSSLQNPVTVYASPGHYMVCLFVSSDHGCLDTICRELQVIPAEVVAPNVITPNGDGTNDFLVFRYLEFYNNNHLEIYDRWGVLLYSKDQYANDWNGSKYADGTYYYILSVPDNGKSYRGFFQLVK